MNKISQALSIAICITTLFIGLSMFLISCDTASTSSPKEFSEQGISVSFANSVCQIENTNNFPMRIKYVYLNNTYGEVTLKIMLLQPKETQSFSGATRLHGLYICTTNGVEIGFIGLWQ